MTTLPTPIATDDPTAGEQASILLGHVAGYMAHRVVEIGLRSGLIARIAESPGATAEAIAHELRFDPFYVSVWCRAAFGACVLERSGHGFAVAPYMDTLLLQTDSPAAVGALFPLVQQAEMFDRFADVLAGGERMWWKDTGPEWIEGVAATGRPFYARLVPSGLAQVPGLADRLESGGLIVDAACGSGFGLCRLADAYPGCAVVGVDGDAHSVASARCLVTDAGLDDRVELVCTPLEEMRLGRQATMIVNNISMHECRDIDRVTDRVLECLEPGGWFVISDFPFPDTDQGLRTIAGRIMSGIQFFEAQIDDQLLSRSVYDDLLTRHGFTDLGSVQLTPVHALTWGRRPV